MRNTIKKKITKGILLFLFGLFSVGVQAQYDENEPPHWSTTAVGQLIANALTNSDSWESSESFFVKDQEGHFVRIDFSLEEVVVTKGNGSGNFNFKDDEEPLFDELVLLEELTPEELAEAKETVQVIPNCPKWYVWDGAQCVLVPFEKLRDCYTATLADHSYYMKDGVFQGGASLPPSTTIVPKSSLLKDSEGKDLVLTDPNTGFNSSLYKVDHGNGKIEYVYSTAGTDDPKDAWHDVLQATGFESAQYKKSVDNAIALNKWADENHFTLSFTGHSLGGGLANANALATGLKATIYNPAGLSDGTLANDPRLILSNTGNVTAHVVRGDPVAFANAFFQTPVRGSTKYIGSVAAPVLLYGSASVVAGSTFGGGLALVGAAGFTFHRMSYVKATLDCY